MDPNGQTYFDEDSAIPETDKRRLAEAQAELKKLEEQKTEKLAMNEPNEIDVTGDES